MTRRDPSDKAPGPGATTEDVPEPAGADSTGVPAPTMSLRLPAVVGLLAAGLLLTYAVVIVTPYAVTDDYFRLAQTLRGESFDLGNRAFKRSRSGEPTVGSSLARGCVTSAVMTVAAFELAGTIENLRWIRFFGVIGIALLGALLVRALTRAGWPLARSGALAFLMCTTPSFQVCGSWAILFSVFYACAAAGLACELSLRALVPGVPRRRQLRLFVVVGALLLFAVTIYQVSLMYLLVFAAIHVFRPRPDAARDERSMLGLAAVTAGGLGLGFVAYQIGLALFGRWLPSQRTHMVHDFGAKLQYALTGPWRDAFQLGVLRPTPYLAPALFVAIFSGLFLYFEGTLRERLKLLALAVLLVPLVYLPNLMTSENWGAYRTQLALDPLVVLYAFLAAHGYAKALGARAQRMVPGVVAAATVLSGLMTVHNLALYYAEPQMAELRVVKNQLSRLKPEKIKKLHIAGANWTSALTGVRYDEFGLPSTAQWWSAPSMVYVLTAERLGHLPKFPILQAPNNLPFKPPAGEWLINLSAFEEYR